MRYPLSSYYSTTEFCFDEIVDDFVSFYEKNHGKEAVAKIVSRINKSTKVKNLCRLSASRHVVPDIKDFEICVHSMLWFIFKSTKTFVLGVLTAILYWDENVNSHLHLAPDSILRNYAINLFERWKIDEEMTEQKYHEFVDRKENVLQESCKPVIIGKENYKDFIKTWSFDEYESLYGTLKVVELCYSGHHRHVCVAEKDPCAYIEFSSELGDQDKNDFRIIRVVSRTIRIGKLPSGRLVMYKEK